MNLTSKIRSKAQGGFGLLEMILVFILVIGAAAVVFTMFGSAKPSAEASNESQELSTLAANLQGTFGLGRDYSNLTDASAVQAKAVPENMVSGTTAAPTIINGWGGDLTLGPGANKTQFSIEYAGIPAAACVKFVTAAAGFFDNVGNTANAADGTYRQNGGPVNTSKIVTDCSAGTIGGANPVYFQGS